MNFEEFKQDLIRAFPPGPFYGLVSTHDECDDGIDLRRMLPGKRWDEVPADFIDFNSAPLPLMEHRALVAFLPAWLLRAMERLVEGSVLSEYTMYFFCPGSEDEGWEEERIAQLIRLFDAPQRVVISDYLRAIAEREALKYWHPYAEFGLKWWPPAQ